MHHNYILKYDFSNNNCFELIVDLVECFEKGLKEESDLEINSSFDNKIQSYKWKFQDFQLNFEKDSIMNSLSLILNTHEVTLMEHLKDQIQNHLKFYSFEELLAMGESNPLKIDIVSYGTYFIRPYPKPLLKLIEQYMMSDNELIVRRAIMAAGLSRKKHFLPILNVLKSKQRGNIVLKNIEISIDLLNDFSIKTPEYTTLD